MLPVPAGTVRIFEPDDPGGERVVEIGPFWMSKTEITWDEFDVWMLGLDQESPGDVDAESRPSSPYGAPDQGFGHAGYAAISISYHSAEHYANWLSQKTGKTYRLPTDVEWLHACKQGLGFDDIEAELVEEQAWHRGNAGSATHPVASKMPNALGIFDMLGNVAEWATPTATKPVLYGGSFRDEPSEIRCELHAVQSPAWNASDPQIPPSQWWLADAPFAGFRIVSIPERQ
jgi:formylglycine-generating enzyme required for sulfatase activity